MLLIFSRCEQTVLRACGARKVVRQVLQGEPYCWISGWAVKAVSASSDHTEGNVWKELDYKPASLGVAREKTVSRRDVKKQGTPVLQPLSKEVEDRLLFSREETKAAEVWNNDNTYPNPLAPGAYIDFRRLDDAGAVVQALWQSRDYLQMRQIVAAMTRFRSGGMAVSPQTINGLIDMALRTIGSTRMEDVVGMFLSCARFRVADKSDFLNELAQLTIERGYVKDMTIRELATMVHSCGKLIRFEEKRVGTRIGKEPHGSQTIAMPPSGFEEHGECASGIAKVEELLEVLIEEISTLREPDDDFELRLPSILKSLSFFGRKDARLDQLVERLASTMLRFRNLSEVRVAALVFAVANCRGVNRNLLSTLSAEVTKPDRLAAFSTQHLIGIIHAFSNLEFNSRGLWISLFLEICQPIRLKELTRTQLPILVGAFVSSQLCRDLELLTRITDEVFSEDRLQELTAEELIRLICIFGGLPRKIPIDGTRFLTKILDRGYLIRMHPSRFTSFVVGLTKLKLPGSCALFRLLDLAKKRKALASLSPNDICRAGAAFPSS